MGTSASSAGAADAGAEKGSWQQWLAASFSPKSQAGYRYGIRRYLSWIGGEAEAQVATYADVLAYLAHLRALLLRPRTLNNYLFAVKLYYRWLQSTGQRSDHPCARLRLRDQIDRSVPLDKLYTPEQLEALASDNAASLRNRVIVGLLVHQALMVSEIVAIRVGEVDLKKGTVYIGESVSNRSRSLPLLALQILDLQALIAGRGPTKTLILSFYQKPLKGHSLSRIINEKRKGKARLLPSRIRQSVIHHKLKAGHDLRIVQSFAGHRQLSTTEAYQQNALEQLRAGLIKYHPLR
jgi:integrase/recombinase XerD